MAKKTEKEIAGAKSGEKIKAESKTEKTDMVQKENKIKKYVPFLKGKKARPEAKGGAKSRMEKAATLKNISALTKDSLDVLKFVLMTERAVHLIETQNKLVFVVDRRANKPEIKKAAEDVFNAKVSGVKTMVDQEGRKKAFVKFEKAGEAGEIAIRLGII